MCASNNKNHQRYNSSENPPLPTEPPPLLTYISIPKLHAHTHTHTLQPNRSTWWAKHVENRAPPTPTAPSLLFFPLGALAAHHHHIHYAQAHSAMSEQIKYDHHRRLRTVPAHWTTVASRSERNLDLQLPLQRNRERAGLRSWRGREERNSRPLELE